MTRRLKVLHFPHFDGNPYQELLLDGFSDVDAELTKGYPSDILNSLLNSKPDVVHIHWISEYLVHRNRGITVIKSISFLAFCILLRLLGVHIVWTAHNIKNHEKINPSYEVFFKSQFCRLVDKIIVHCDSAKDPLESGLGVSKKKMISIPHGHYLSAYPNTISPDKARLELGIKDAEMVFTFFGQVRPYKQIPLLIKAFQRANPADTKLVIAGNPLNQELRENVESLAENDPRIETHLRYIPESDIQVFLNASDVVILPFSDVLTSGSAVLAMSFANPVIAPRRGCVKELLSKQDQLLVDNVDIADSLEKKITEATNFDLDDIGRNNQEQIKKFSWGRIAHETESIYINLS